VAAALVPAIPLVDVLGVLLGVDEVPLVDPEGDVDGVDGEVEVEEVEPAPPIVDEPGAPAGLNAAFVSVQLSSVPCRQPVTVTFLALLAGVLAVVDDVPLVPVVPGSVLCVPLCAATLTAKAHANATPVAGPNTRFMCSSS
jgi:hypothetical protein